MEWELNKNIASRSNTVCSNSETGKPQFYNAEKNSDLNYTQSNYTLCVKTAVANSFENPLVFVQHPGAVQYGNPVNEQGMNLTSKCMHII